MHRLLRAVGVRHMTRTAGRRTLLRRSSAVALLGCAAGALSAAPALADGESITITQNDSSAVVGYATNFTAAGTLNPADTMFGFDIYIFMKDADLDPTCAADFKTESSAASASGGNERWISPPGGFEVGTGPDYSQPFKITFGGTGHYLICGYVNGDFSTFANGELRGVVNPAPGTTPTTPPAPPAPPAPGTPAPTAPTTPTVQAPRLVRAPWITDRHHVLTCHPGTWANAPTSKHYAWSIKGTSKKLGSRSTLRVRGGVRNRRVVCKVTASNAAGHRTAASRAVRAR